jgi:hypothetical protein
MTREREEIELKVMKNVPATIKKLQRDKKWQEALTYWKNILHLQYVANCAELCQPRRAIGIN